jgi:hypothetical protein
MNQCVICTRDNRDGFACAACTTTLADDLRTLGWLASELFITRTRQARLAGGTRSRGGSPLAFHPRAAMAYDQLHNNLFGWVRVIRSGDQWPADAADSMAAWLADRADRLRLHPAVDDLAQDVKAYTDDALNIINPTPDEQTYGVCGEVLVDGRTCDSHLYGPPRVDWVRCGRCDTQHNARQRTQALEARMTALYFRAATLARLLPRLLERPVSDNNIRAWARERPDAVRTERDADGVVTYHCGDVIAIAASTPKRDRPGKKAS